MGYLRETRKITSPRRGHRQYRSLRLLPCPCASLIFSALAEGHAAGIVALGMSGAEDLTCQGKRLVSYPKG
jgi:hypothetical protein